MKKIILFLSGIFMLTLIGIVPASALSDEPLKITRAYSLCERENIFNYKNNSFSFGKIPYYDGATLIDPVVLSIEYNQDIAQKKIKYSLYTFKKSYLQEMEFDHMQSVREWDMFNRSFDTWINRLNRWYYYSPPTTESDIEEKLDKIYEFPIEADRFEYYELLGLNCYILDWDGYTDPQFTDEKYAVRGPLYIVARNADTDEIIDTYCTRIETKGIYCDPGIKYRIDTDADGKKTISANVFLAYPDEWKIKKLTVVLLTDACLIGPLKYETVNQGAEAMIANMAKEVVAYKALENPAVDPDNPNIKIFDWKDIKTTRQVKPMAEALEARGEAATKTQEEREKNVPKPEAYKNYEDFVSALREYFDTEDFIPDWDVWYLGFRLGFILETDEMTITGIKDGYCEPMSYYIPDADDPVRWVFTGLQTIAKPEGITITQTPAGFRVDCENGVYANDLTVYDTAGKMVKKASLQGNTQTQEVSADLSNGIYFVKVTGTNGNQPVSATLKFIKKN